MRLLLLRGHRWTLLVALLNRLLLYGSIMNSRILVCLLPGIVRRSVRAGCTRQRWFRVLRARLSLKLNLIVWLRLGLLLASKDSGHS